MGPPPIKRQHQQRQSQSEPLNCPRCESANTKFCYYNNYKSSQPRHFCRACKRHWTKGGILRNVPIGGCRKNKRLKPSNAAAAATRKAADFGGGSSVDDCRSPGMVMAINGQNQMLSFPLFPPSSNKENSFSSSDVNFNGGNLNGDDGVLMDLTLSPPQGQESQFSSCFESNPCSISSSIDFPDLLNFLGETAMASHDTTVSDPPWKTASISCVMEMETTNWGWDIDIGNFVSSDLAIKPWDDDAEIKP
ncbi:hypothetical protein Nepgr_032182 [Nepenthes gracilis]|uniref:Dof zinc finger protein n=1 Tax=Nepenthes gracilis TaxID=150966 RepID=A0AAD3TJH6_NEPGR|nr:hypothetical protein Nepgr_032182 [Nepenthes gracilis]